LVEDHCGIFDPYWEAITKEERFLDGERYELDNGPEQRDRRLTQIRGQEIQDTVRHFAAEATARPRSVEARPVDSDTDADAAEVEVALVDQELRNPWKGFETRYYEAVLDSREKRMGILWMDWEPGYGEYGGEIMYRTIDPRRAMWDAPYDPHHPLCGWFLEKRRCDVGWIHRNYPKTKSWLKPDGQSLDATGQKLREGVPIVRGSDGHSMLPTSSVRDNKAELWLCWYKNDETYAKRETGKELELDPDQRYLACANGCGYRSPTQGELLEQGKIAFELPEELDGCPTCEAEGLNGTLKRIDRRSEEEQVRAFARGKRLVIIAPFQPAPDDDTVYDGKWPIPRARSFPGLFLWSYLAPRKPMGKSDVTLMWDQQVASDNLATMALQRVFEHRNYWVLPAVGLYDYRGERFTFRDDQYNHIYRDMSKAEYGSLQVESLNSTGLDTPGWSAAWNAVQDKLTRYRGVTDYGLTPDASKNIAVGTVERLTQQGNIPIEEYNRRKNQELGKFYGVVSDYIHATYTPRRLTRLNIDGIDLVLGLWGDDMPNFDFVIEETPPFTGLEKARNEAFNGLIQILPMAAQAGLPPEDLVDLYAETNNLPRTTVRKFKKMLEAARALKEEQAAMAGGGDGALEEGLGSEGAPAPDDLESLMSSEGFSGTSLGMEPEPIQ
jgi:hypothetical protein